MYPTGVNSVGSVDTEKTTHSKSTLTQQEMGAAGTSNVTDIQQKINQYHRQCRYIWLHTAIAVTTTGDKYCNYKLTKIEKGNLLEIAYRTTAEISDKLPNSGIDDKRLL